MYQLHKIVFPLIVPVIKGLLKYLKSAFVADDWRWMYMGHSRFIVTSNILVPITVSWNDVFIIKIDCYMKMNNWTANDHHSLKVKDIIWQDHRSLSFYFLSVRTCAVCVCVFALHATILITQTCRSIFRYRYVKCTAWCHE